MKCVWNGDAVFPLLPLRLMVNPPLCFPQSSRCSLCLQTVNKCQRVLWTDVCCSVLGSEITFPGPAHSLPLDHKGGGRQVNHPSPNKGTICQGQNLHCVDPCPSKTSLIWSSWPEEQTHCPVAPFLLSSGNPGLLCELMWPSERAEALGTICRVSGNSKRKREAATWGLAPGL